MIIVGLFVEYQAQEIWGLSFTYKEAGRKYNWLRGVYIWYIIVFALTSGIGIILTEINNQGAVTNRIQTAKTNYQSQIDRLNRDIDGLTRQRDTEGNTGTGNKYQYLQSKIDDDNKRLDKLTKNMDKIDSKVQSKDMYINIEQETGIPKIWLIYINCGSALAMVYLGLMLRPMKVDIENIPKQKLTQSDVTIPLSEVFSKVSKEDGPLPTTSDTTPTESENKPVLTSEQLKKLDFINALWGDSKEEFPDNLTPLEKTGFAERTAIKYSDYFRDIGAIEKVQGRPCKPKWPLSKIIRYIEKEGVS